MAGLRNVCLSANRKVVLDSVSYQFKNNKITCFVGIDDTRVLLDLLLGILKPNHGIVDISSGNIGYFANDIDLNQFALVYDYLVLGMNMDETGINRKIIDMLDMIGLNENYLLRNLKELTDSEKSKIIMGKMLLSDYSVMIFDNPSRYLDYRSLKCFEKVVKSMCKNRSIIIIILTDDIDFASSVGDELVIFEDGKLIDDFNVKDIFEHLNLLKNSKVGLSRILEFIDLAYQKRKVELNYCDSISDLVKEVARHV